MAVHQTVSTPHPAFGHLLPASGEKGNEGVGRLREKGHHPVVAPRPACGERVARSAG